MVGCCVMKRASLITVKGFIVSEYHYYIFRDDAPRLDDGLTDDSISL